MARHRISDSLPCAFCLPQAQLAESKIMCNGWCVNALLDHRCQLQRCVGVTARCQRQASPAKANSHKGLGGFGQPGQDLFRILRRALGGQ
jgi:hypothetical protein